MTSGSVTGEHRAQLNLLIKEYQALKAENARLRGEQPEENSERFITSVIGQAFKHLAYQSGTVAAVVGAVEGYFGGGIIGNYLPSGLIGGVGGYLTAGPIGAAAGYYGIGNTGGALGSIGELFGGGAPGAVAAGTAGCIGAVTGVLLVGKGVQVSVDKAMDLAIWTINAPYRFTMACLGLALKCCCLKA